MGMNPLAGNVRPKAPTTQPKPPVMAGTVVSKPPKTTPKTPVMAGKVVPKPPIKPNVNIVRAIRNFIANLCKGIK